MNTDLVIFGYFLCLIGFLTMWCLLNQDEFFRIAFQTDSERIDLYIKRQMEAIADKKIQEQKDKIKKILGDLQ